MIDLPERDLIDLSSEAFMKMKRLRLFINRNARFSEVPNFLSNELRVIDWPGYPGKSLPSNFRGKNLVVLRMRNSHLKRLKGVEVQLFLVGLNAKLIPTVNWGIIKSPPMFQIWHFLAPVIICFQFWHFSLSVIHFLTKTRIQKSIRV